MSCCSVAQILTVVYFSLCLFLSNASSSPLHKIICDDGISCSIDTCSSDHSCKDHDIYCADNYNCTVICDNEKACYGATIYCPENAHCFVNCGMFSVVNDTQICRYINIFALHSSALTISIGSNQAMRDSYIECPDNGMYISSAAVTCQILFLRNAITPLINSTIMAVEGLHDINIVCECSGFCCLYGDEIVECTADGSSSCVLNSTTTCDRNTLFGDVNCETYVLPSDNPTPQPTEKPTVPNPTLSPSFSPTIEPTNVPTIPPSSEPSFEPTMDPTFEPTTEPSSSPTLEPTLPTYSGNTISTREEAITTYTNFNAFVFFVDNMDIIISAIIFVLFACFICCILCFYYRKHIAIYRKQKVEYRKAEVQRRSKRLVLHTPTIDLATDNNNDEKECIMSTLPCHTAIIPHFSSSDCVGSTPAPMSFDGKHTAIQLVADNIPQYPITAVQSNKTYIQPVSSPAIDEKEPTDDSTNGRRLTDYINKNKSVDEKTRDVINQNNSLLVNHPSYSAMALKVQSRQLFVDDDKTSLDVINSQRLTEYINKNKSMDEEMRLLMNKNNSLLVNHPSYSAMILKLQSKQKLFPKEDEKSSRNTVSSALAKYNNGNKISVGAKVGVNVNVDVHELAKVSDLDIDDDDDKSGSYSDVTLNTVTSMTTFTAAPRDSSSIYIPPSPEVSNKKYITKPNMVGRAVASANVSKVKDKKMVTFIPPPPLFLTQKYSNSNSKKRFPLPIVHKASNNKHIFKNSGINVSTVSMEKQMSGDLKFVHHMRYESEEKELTSPVINKKRLSNKSDVQMFAYDLEADGKNVNETAGSPSSKKLSPMSSRMHSVRRSVSGFINDLMNKGSVHGSVRDSVQGSVLESESDEDREFYKNEDSENNPQFKTSSKMKDTSITGVLLEGPGERSHSSSISQQFVVESNINEDVPQISVVVNGAIPATSTVLDDGSNFMSISANDSGYGNVDESINTMNIIESGIITDVSNIVTEENDINFENNETVDDSEEYEDVGA